MLFDGYILMDTVVPLIDSMALEGLNIKDIDPNEFAQRWAKIY